MDIIYKIKKTEPVTVSEKIEDENFVCVGHIENGKFLWTAFIGTGENNNKKLSIKICTSGGLLDIRKMAGGAVFNAEILLSQDEYNHIVPNSAFIDLYEKQKQHLLIDLKENLINKK